MIIIIISTNHPNSNHYCIPGVIEGVQRALSSAALVVLKKKGMRELSCNQSTVSSSAHDDESHLIGMLHGPYRATTVGASLVNGKTIAK